MESPNQSKKEFEDSIQGYIITWNQYRLAANIPTAIFMSAFLGMF